MNSFDEALAGVGATPLRADNISILQINVGLLCNLECNHCHLGAGPTREEVMSWETMERIVEISSEREDLLIDITGGSPEMNPNLKRFILAMKGLGHSVQVRTNLSVLTIPAYSDFVEFYSDNEIPLVGSLPCYLEENVTAQRGPRAFAPSIMAIKRLNEVGYGERLPLDLVYNPGGPFLPPSQGQLEVVYKRELNSRYELVFSKLLTITNMPLGRFYEKLKEKDEGGAYEELLRSSFNPQTLGGLMCRHQISIAWDGSISDCDFNYALGLPTGFGAPRNISDFSWEELENRRIVTDDHCLGCTAGAGSSCGGQLGDSSPEDLCRAV